MVYYEKEVLTKVVAECVAGLRDLCAISSATGDAAGLRTAAERLGADLRRCGLEIEITEEEDEAGTPQPCLLARGPNTAAGHLLLLGHLDTVLAATEPVLHDDRLEATGALDMKGGLAALVGALQLLAGTGREAPDDLLLVVVPDEESAGVISERCVRRYSEKARAVLVLEPGEKRGQAETLVAGRRGLTEWTLEATGRAAHSGLAFWEGRSALGAAATFCGVAQDVSRRGRGPTVNVARLVAGSHDFVDGLENNHDLLGTSRQRNVVPDRARADGEIRYLDLADREEILSDLDRICGKIAQEYELQMSLTLGAEVPPVDPGGPGAELVKRAVQLAAARGFRLEIEEDRGGISFPNFLEKPLPVIDGLGPVGEGMHVRGEHVLLESLERRIVLLADLLESLAENEVRPS